MKKIHLIILICLISGFIGTVCLAKLIDIPFVKRQMQWSIGIYTGSDPFNFVAPENISNPVLTARDVRDIPAEFVADPFMVKEDSRWYMFFEVMNSRTNQGDIGLAISDDGLNWHYQQIVLNEYFHLSYPYVFKWKGEYYMIPETQQANSVQLYQAVDFPTRWSFVGTLLANNDCLDSSVFRFQDKWWLFQASRENDTLRLYYAQELLGPWTEHPKSPIISKDANIARPAGRVLMFDKRLYRYTQDDTPIYGNQVRAFEITELTPTSYEEKEVSQTPILTASGTGWNKNGMHHIDAHKIGNGSWIACVDGFYTFLAFGLQY